MTPLPLTRACVLVPAAVYLRRLGGSLESLLASVGVPAAALASPEAMIPTAAMARFLRNAARRHGIDAFGALAGGSCDVASAGHLGGLVASAPTLREALRETVVHGPRISSGGRVWLRSHGADLQLCHAFPVGADPAWRQAEHYVVRLLIEILRLGAGSGWTPARVQLQTPECTALRDVDGFAGARLEFGQRIATIGVPRRLLDLPLPAGAPAREGAALAAWRAARPASTFVDAVAQVVETLMGERPPHVGKTAAVLGTSQRTLQRRLMSAGTTHDALVARARLACAASLLTETEAAILEVALATGYSDHAHFTRAFRRWTGLSPRDYRRAHRDAAVPRVAAAAGPPAE